ncbi:MAG: MBL fold metallo-hydrolase [Desulfobacterales bacterium]|nr:MBL fold metallo-hydrolase [Desulfobacterales bacterium]
MVENIPTCSLISDGDMNVLIDLDHPRNDRTNLIKKLADYGRLPCEIDVVILTHLHPDHIGNKDLFPDARFVFHREEKMSFYFNNNHTYKMDKNIVIKLGKGEKPRVSDSIPNVNDLENHLYIRHCPGHTRGSLVIFTNIDGLVYAFAGDIFLNKDFYNRWEPPGMSWNREKIYEHMEYIHKNADVIVPGHGKPFKT